MKVKSLFLFGAALCFDCTSPLSAQNPLEFDTSPYQYQRELIGAPTGNGLCVIILDPKIHRLSGPSHEKLRLLKRKSEGFSELPWIIEPAEPGNEFRGEEHIPHRIESFDENDDGSIELTVTLAGNTPPPSRLEILTPLRDFEKSVTVFSDVDGSTWSPLVRDALIFDYERFLDFRRTSVSIPESKSRRFKVQISKATDRQRSLVKEITRTVSGPSGVTLSEGETLQTRLFRIDEVRFFTAATKNEKSRSENSYEIDILEQKQIPDEKTTEIHLDGGGLPIHELILSTQDKNFRREVSLQIPDNSPSGGWRTIHQSTIHSYRVGDFHEERLSLRFGEVRSSRYRMLLKNHDSPPLSISAVAGRGDIYELLFLAEPGDQCVLFLGSPSESMTKPRFDTAAILAAKGQQVVREQFEPGPMVENPLFRKEQASDQRILDSKESLWAIIAGVVVVLIIVLYKTLRRVDALGETD